MDLRRNGTNSPKTRTIQEGEGGIKRRGEEREGGRRNNK